MTGTGTAQDHAAAGQRIDKWLWYARFFKSRSLATRLCNGAKMRINRRIVAKASATVKAGDVLTFPQADRIRTVRVIGPGARRGPAGEARLLYEDLAPASLAKPGSPDGPGVLLVAPRSPGSGRPTKFERRATDRLSDKNQPPDRSSG